MADEKLVTVDSLYGKLTDFIDEAQGNQTYDYLVNMLRSGHSELFLTEKFIRKDVDTRWLEAIETCIVPLDEIIRKPNRFIRNDEDVVSIEKARGITVDSIRDLAQHSDYIGENQEGELTPTKILNVTKEEAFDTYENRFIYTLIKKLIYFIDQRAEGLSTVKTSNAQLSYVLNGETKVGSDSIKYEFKMSFETDAQAEEAIDRMVKADITTMSSIQRVNRIRSIIYTYAGSAFMKNLKGCAEVRPPLNMTNMLKKNPNFQACVELWNYVDTYEDKGYEIESVDRIDQPDEVYLNRLYAMIGMQYILLKKNSANNNASIEITERRQVMKPHIISNTIDEVMDTFDLSLDEVQKVYMEQIASKRKREQQRLAKIREIINRAISAEKVNLKNDAKYDDRLKKKGELNPAYRELNYDFENSDESSNEAPIAVETKINEIKVETPIDETSKVQLEEETTPVEYVTASAEDEETKSNSTEEQQTNANVTIESTSTEENKNPEIVQTVVEKVEESILEETQQPSLESDPENKADSESLSNPMQNSERNLLSENELEPTEDEDLTPIAAPETLIVPVEEKGVESKNDDSVSMTGLIEDSKGKNQVASEKASPEAVNQTVEQSTSLEEENSQPGKEETSLEEANEVTSCLKDKISEKEPVVNESDGKSSKNLLFKGKKKDRRSILLYRIQHLNFEKEFVKEKTK